MFRNQKRKAQAPVWPNQHYQQQTYPQQNYYAQQQPFVGQPYTVQPNYGYNKPPVQSSPYEPTLPEVSQIDRFEREIVELNRRINNLTRRLRRLEDYLNIRDE